jgi:hypothetical protein
VPSPPAAPTAPALPPGSLFPSVYSFHEYVYYWREAVLYAIRWGPWKAHFFTRPGFGFVAPTPWDPPLLFQVEWDPAEAFPLNSSVAPFDALVAHMTAAAAAHVASVVPVPAQEDPQDFALVLCCDKPFNGTQALEFVAEGTYELGLALWDACVCSDATSPPVA